MLIEKNDLITLSDKNEYVVVSMLVFNSIKFYYIADINNESNLKFCYLENDELVEIKDSNLIMQLLPLFKENTKL